MDGIPTFRRFAALSWRDRFLLVEASAALCFAATAIYALPFRLLAKCASRPGGRLRRAKDETAVDRLVWAVRVAADRLPWKNLCFQRGLALHAMLRRRGVPSRLHYGVGRMPDRPLSAHVWVSVGERVVEGAEGIVGHACLATFPPEHEQPNHNA